MYVALAVAAERRPDRPALPARRAHRRHPLLLASSPTWGSPPDLSDRGPGSSPQRGIGGPAPAFAVVREAVVAVQHLLAGRPLASRRPDAGYDPLGHAHSGLPARTRPRMTDSAARSPTAPCSSSVCVPRPSPKHAAAWSGAPAPLARRLPHHLHRANRVDGARRWRGASVRRWIARMTLTYAQRLEPPLAAPGRRRPAQRPRISDPDAQAARIARSFVSSARRALPGAAPRAREEAR